MLGLSGTKCVRCSGELGLHLGEREGEGANRPQKAMLSTQSRTRFRHRKKTEGPCQRPRAPVTSFLTPCIVHR